MFRFLNPIFLTFVLLIPMTAMAQDSRQDNQFIEDEVIVTGKIKGGDDAMTAFLNGDYATAEIEFKKNFKNLTRAENIKINTFIQTQNNQTTAQILNAPPQIGGQGGAAPASLTAPTLDVRGLNQIARKPDENTLKSGSDRGFQLYMIGLSQIQLNKYDDAKISFIRAIRLNKKLYDARTRLGLIYLSEANFDEARYQLIKLNDARMRCKHKCRDSAQIKQATLTLAKELAR